MSMFWLPLMAKIDSLRLKWIVLLPFFLFLISFSLSPNEHKQLTPVGVTVFRGIHAVDRDQPNTANSDITYSIVVSIHLNSLHSFLSPPDPCFFIISLICLIHTPTFTEPFLGSQESWHAYRIPFTRLFPFMSCVSSQSPHKQNKKKKRKMPARDIKCISLQTKYCIKKETWPSLSLCNDTATFSLCRDIIMSRNSLPWISLLYSSSPSLEDVISTHLSFTSCLLSCVSATLFLHCNIYSCQLLLLLCLFVGW